MFEWLEAKRRGCQWQERDQYESVGKLAFHPRTGLSAPPYRSGMKISVMYRAHCALQMWQPACAASL